MSTTTEPASAIVVLGVSGSGKTTVGRSLADALGVSFRDADDLHSPANRAKMASGRPLTDDDRWPWLDAVGEALARGRDDGIVVACSALRRAYRDRLRAACPDVLFVHLDGTRDLLRARIGARLDHFMPPELLDSQLATLEPLGADERGFVVDIAPSPPEIIAAIRSRIAGDEPAANSPVS